MSINKSKLSGFILREQPGTNVWRKYCELQIKPGKEKGNSELGFSFEGSASNRRSQQRAEQIHCYR